MCLCMYVPMYIHIYTHTHTYHYHQNVYVTLESCLYGGIINQKTIYSIAVCTINPIHIIIRATNPTSEPSTQSFIHG